MRQLFSVAESGSRVNYSRTCHAMSCGEWDAQRMKNLATYIVVSYVDLLNHFEYSLRVCDQKSDTECAAAVILMREGKSAWSIFLLLAQKR